MPNNGLSMNSSELTKNDIVVTYTPSDGIISYSYKLFKNDEVIKTVDVIDNSSSTIIMNETGNYRLEITVFDGKSYDKVTSGIYKIDKNNTKEQVVVDTKKGYSQQLFVSQMFVCAILITILVLLVIYNKSLKKEKRLAKYTVKQITDDKKTLFETFVVIGNNIIDKISSLVSKSEIAKKQGKKYEKYISAFNQKNIIYFISKKVFVGLLFILGGFIVATLRLQTLNIYSIIILFVVGFYTLDIIYKYKYHMYCRKIENDLLQAIIVMNNAFKSGRSIRQAIELVANELTGPISIEFKKISKELELGLDIEVAFKRFAERINIEEATYLTSSLSILNRTGGNIVKVFSSIEKTLFNRKKLRIELKELTGSSRIIMWVLSIVPIAFGLIMILINPEYFNPLYTNILGIFTIGVIIVLYIAYVIVVRKIMNIRL